MTFTVTRRSTIGGAKWKDVPSNEVSDLIVRDLIESGAVKDIFAEGSLEDEARETAVRAAVVLRGLTSTPYPPMWEGFGNTYSIEQTLDLAFPVELAPDDNETVLVTFPDIPGAITFGNSEEDALDHAVDCLETMLLAYMLDRKDIPIPSSVRSRPTVQPTLLGTLKVMLYQAMRDRGWRKADLAREMELNPRQIDRLLDLRHASTVRQLEHALAACGKRADVSTRELRAA